MIYIILNDDACAISGLDVRANSFVIPPYEDIDEISSWAGEAMYWAGSVGLIRGRGTTALASTVTASREEVTTMILRFLNLSTGIENM